MVLGSNHERDIIMIGEGIGIKIFNKTTKLGFDDKITRISFCLGSLYEEGRELEKASSARILHAPRKSVVASARILQAPRESVVT